MDFGKLNSLYKDFIPWLCGQYDGSSGGFYYAASSRTDESFQPDIESTAQAISILEMTGLLDRIPGETREKMISFFRSRQNEKGYFLDPHNEMKSVDRMVARAISYSVNSLARLGSAPLHPLPGGDREALPEHMRSLENFDSWLENRPWGNAWMACDNISAAAVYIRNMPSLESERFLGHLLPWLENRQNKETGMWGEGQPYIRLSGAFKLSLFYRNLNMPMPLADRIFDFLLETLRTDHAEDFCWVRNPIDLLSVLLEMIPQPSREIMEEIFAITLDNLAVFLKEDGGFSRNRDHSLAMPNNQVLGKGLAEGDMNAGTQAIRIRMLLNRMENREPGPLYGSGLISSLGM